MNKETISLFALIVSIFAFLNTIRNQYKQQKFWKLILEVESTGPTEFTDYEGSKFGKIPLDIWDLTISEF